MGRRRHRSLGIAALVAIVAGALVAPTAAAAKTRWVDDDGKAGPTGCAGTAGAKTAIQAAIKASAAGDTVKICPGTYTGRLMIQGARDGLKLIAATTTKPVIQLAPTTETTILSISAVDDVAVRGLSLRSDSADPCGGRAGIAVADAKRATLSGLRIESVGATTLSGCTLSIGISVAASSATIANVRIVNAAGIAIQAYDTSTIAVKNATVDYFHALDTGLPSGTMIKAQEGSKGSLKHITVNGLATAGSSTPRLSTAVALQDARAGFVIQDVVVSYAATGLKVSNSRDAVIAGVDVTGASTAVLLESGAGADLSGVTVPGSQYGIRVSGATGATIHGNDLTGATVVGCTDETSGGTGTLGPQNTWTNNLTSTTSSPDGLCTEP